jgi:hypothetical protein
MSAIFQILHQTQHDMNNNWIFYFVIISINEGFSDTKAYLLFGFCWKI